MKNLRKNKNFHPHNCKNHSGARTKISTTEMTHFAGESWNGNHLPNGPGPVYNTPEVPFPQIWNQEGAATYNDIIGFQDLGKKIL